MKNFLDKDAREQAEYFAELRERVWLEWLLVLDRRPLESFVITFQRVGDKHGH